MNDGPLVCRNWQAAINGASSQGASEFPFYTDSRITGQVSEALGPYKLLNTIAGESKSGSVRPSVVLRVEHHLQWDPDADDPGNEHFHGGYLSDAVAALLSMALGVRMKSGSMNRRFDLCTGDPRGRPVSYSGRWEDEPTLSKTGEGPILPDVVGDRALNDAKIIYGYHTLEPSVATSILRAARLYQDAVWIAESEPQLAWLMLVSAVESVADQWWEGEETPTETLEASQPDLFNLLKDRGGDELVEEVAENLAPRLRSTKKFISFLMEFQPGPPEERPQEYWQMDWSEPSLKKIFSKVYDRRSRALHDGKPFPAPMCTRPEEFGDAYSEIPWISGTLGATWESSEAPMLLHTFERIARYGILSWWRSID